MKEGKRHLEEKLAKKDEEIATLKQASKVQNTKIDLLNTPTPLASGARKRS